jgi:signal transduction histidine kinase
MGVPIRRGDHVEGLLYVGNRSTRSFSNQDQAILTRLADHAAIAIQDARLSGQLSATGKRLRALSRRLVRVEEAERRHIARELHDEVGQALTGLKLSLEMSARLAGDALSARLGEAQALADELIGQVRRLSLDLRPAMLDDLGLLPALLWHIERYTARTGVALAFEHAGLDRRFPPDVETAAYRIVQEALTNVARHAGVREAALRIGAADETLRLVIQDHGTGFTAESALAGYATSGLAGMHERAVLLGGRLTVESAPGAGTCVTAELPLGAQGERKTEDGA